MTRTKASLEQQYLDVAVDLLDAPLKTNRTDTDTWELPGVTLKADLTDGFPALTTKRLYFRHVVSELVWFLRGGTNIAFLHKHENHIWDEWADKDGNLGPVYGAQWRRFGAHYTETVVKDMMQGFREGAHEAWQAAGRDVPSGWASEYDDVASDYRGGFGVDQLAKAIHDLKHNPDSRRIIVSGWNPLEMSAMRLPPCHVLYQFLVSGGKLHTIAYQRSADWFLGVPFNIASYALLTHIVGGLTGWEPGTLTLNYGSAHLYVNHVDQMKLQLSRDIKRAPQLGLRAGALTKGIDALDPGDFYLQDYVHHPAIKAPVAV